MVYKKACYKLLAEICEIIDNIENNLDINNQALVGIQSQLIRIIIETEDIIVSRNLKSG